MGFTVLTIGFGGYLIVSMLDSDRAPLTILAPLVWAAFGASGLLLRRRRRDGQDRLPPHGPVTDPNL
jgi:hypothetical protein